MAKELSAKAFLNAEQLGFVALFAYPMQKQWEKQVKNNPDMANAQSSCYAGVGADISLLDLHSGVLARIIFIGGGGCGKSRVFTQVLNTSLKLFYGRRGVMIEAPSNRAARGVGGITMHVANKLVGSSSLMTANLRAKPNQKAAMQAYSRLGAKLFDELSQLNSKLFHADAY